MPRVCIKDIDSRKILHDNFYEKGQTISIPQGYDIVTRQTNDWDEEWYYVRKTKEVDGST